MAGRKRIIVACGSGVASSQLSANRIKDLLPKYGLKNVQIDVVDFKTAKQHSANADVFVNISPHGKTVYDCPMMSGIPFMTGFGMDAAMEELKKLLYPDGVE